MDDSFQRRMREYIVAELGVGFPFAGYLAEQITEAMCHLISDPSEMISPGEPLATTIRQSVRLASLDVLRDRVFNAIDHFGRPWEAIEHEILSAMRQSAKGSESDESLVHSVVAKMLSRLHREPVTRDQLNGIATRIIAAVRDIDRKEQRREDEEALVNPEEMIPSVTVFIGKQQIEGLDGLTFRDGPGIGEVTVSIPAFRVVVGGEVTS